MANAKPNAEDRRIARLCCMMPIPPAGPSECQRSSLVQNPAPLSPESVRRRATHLEGPARPRAGKHVEAPALRRRQEADGSETCVDEIEHSRPQWILLSTSGRSATGTVKVQQPIGSRAPGAG